MYVPYFLIACLVLLLSHKCLAYTHGPSILQQSPSVLRRDSLAAAVAPGPSDAAYTMQAEDDRIGILPGWGKPDFGLFSGMCQDANQIWYECGSWQGYNDAAT